ncbi:MAG TPA: metallophosphoesterase [Croceibacterium sp.]
MRHIICFVVLLLSSLGATAHAADAPAAAAPALHGTYLHLSDIHLDPFSLPQGSAGQRQLAQQLDAAAVDQWEAILSKAGDGTLTWRSQSDTDYYLLKSTLDEAAKQGPFDYILFTGDYLAHDFIDNVEKSGGVTDAGAFAAKTVQFVNRMVAQQFPGVPIVAGLGNNDSGIGDYGLDLDGKFLAALAPTMPGLAGNLAAQQSFAHGGYYTIPHPTVAGHDFLVLSVFWSVKYPDFAPGGCAVTSAGSDQQRYFEQALASTANQVTLLMHIPPGMDGYSGHNHAPSGQGAATMWCGIAGWETAFEAATAKYRRKLDGGFAGHTHMDEFRVLSAGGRPYLAIRMAPSVTTYNGNKPAFTVATYDTASARTLDYTVHYLANSGAGITLLTANWSALYTFSQGYGSGGYTAAHLGQIAREIRSKPGSARATFTANYNPGHQIPGGPASWPYFACALSAMNETDYVGCVSSIR